MTQNRKFRIFYGYYDHETEDYRYWDYKGAGFIDAIKAPTDGVQVIWQENSENREGRDIVNQKDFYCWREDQGWVGMDQAGYATYMREVGFPKYVIHGYGLRTGAYNECVRWAVTEGYGEE